MQTDIEHPEEHRGLTIEQRNSNPALRALLRKKWDDRMMSISPNKTQCNGNPHNDKYQQEKPR